MKLEQVTHDGPYCETCRFWCADQHYEEDESGDVVQAQCRRFPPAIPATEDSAYFSCTPYTARYEWCGEHQPRPADNTP